MLTGCFAHIFWGQEAEGFSDLQNSIYLAVELMLSNASFFGVIPERWYMFTLGLVLLWYIGIYL